MKKENLHLQIEFINYSYAFLIWKWLIEQSTIRKYVWKVSQVPCWNIPRKTSAALKQTINFLFLSKSSL